MTIVQSLKAGDLRTIGRANAVARRVAKDPSLMDELFQALFHEAAAVNMRASDSFEKIVRDRRELLAPYKKRILKNLATLGTRRELRMHLALVLGYLDLSRPEAVKIAELLLQWLRTDTNKFVQVNCLTGLCDIAMKQPWLRQEVMATIVEYMIKGSAALKARGRILLKKLSAE